MILIDWKMPDMDGIETARAYPRYRRAGGHHHHHDSIRLGFYRARG